MIKQLFHGSDSDTQYDSLLSGIDANVSNQRENDISLYGIWLTDNKDAAKEYACGMYTYTCDVSIKKCLDLTTIEDSKIAEDWLFSSNYVNVSEDIVDLHKFIIDGFSGLVELADMLAVYPQMLQNIIIQKAIDNGYDTVIMHDTNRGYEALSYVVLDNNNITILEVE